MRLTQTVQKGGCAAKIAATTLREILSHVKFPKAPSNLLVDASTFDDAAVYKVSEDQALVQTLDFFTPIVDTPQIFGRIAATNALSDVYAMGGTPLTAMGILAFPIATLDQSVCTQVLQGASDAISTARAAFVGGHSIDDDTLKFGLSVTGVVHPQKIWTNAGAQVGDVLILTKALGTGTLCAGLKRSAYTEDQIDEALESMMQLNDLILDLDETLQSAVHAATDVTGFGLSGHSLQMARASGVSFEIDFSSLPLFSKTLESLEKEHLTKAHRSNHLYTQGDAEWSSLKPLEQAVLHDPQTSGGLLLSVAPNFAPHILTKISTRFKRAQIIGKVILPSDKKLRFRI